jgi:pimeloyl-ACP methyl ester carboxylesterase
MMGRRQLFFTLLKIAEIFAPGVAARRYYRMWFKTHRFDVPKHEQDLMQHAQRVELQAPNRVIAYAWGNGPKVLLVHGWNGRGAQMSAIITRLIDAGYGVIAFDAPGHGASEGDQSSLFEYADTVTSLAEKYGPFAATVTHSFGGLVMAYCIHHQRVETGRLVAIASPVSLRTVFDGWTERLKIRPNVVQRIKSRISQRFGVDVWTDIDVKKLAAGQTLPVLVIHDKQDRDLPFACANYYAKAWESSRLVATEGLGHRKILRDAEVVDKIIGFIRIP